MSQIPTHAFPIFASLLAAGVVATAAGSEARSRPCVRATGAGTGPTEKIAKFQAFEGLLKSVDVEIWSTWLVSGTTGGHRVRQLTYRCRANQGLGYGCTSRARVCLK